MRIARIARRTEAEGPHLRAALWLQGCSIRCPECCNPELFAASDGEDRDPADLAAEIAALEVEGVTLLGGEPLDQRGEVRRFLEALRAAGDKAGDKGVDKGDRKNTGKGVMLFTGHDHAAALERGGDVLALCDLVVAGPFKAELTPDPRRWIGSRNQTVHFPTRRYAELEASWPAHRNEIEIHIRDGEILVSGTPQDSEPWTRLRSTKRRRATGA